MTEPVAEAEDVFVLEPQNISMDAACRDWQSAIDVAGGLLQKQGVITAEYIQGMKEAVEKYGPYCVFCPGVALVHASPENGVNRFGVSLVKLKEPVRFALRLRELLKFQPAGGDKGDRPKLPGRLRRD